MVASSFAEVPARLAAALEGEHPLFIYRGDTKAWRWRLWADDQRTVPYDLSGVTGVAAQIRRSPDDLRKTDDIMSTSIGTDPTLALQTRRGTGFYKVPSLRGIWFRTGIGHAETLEEWFDPARLNDDYVPKGFHLGPGPIEGHEKGLDLSPEDRKALIAFLKTL